MRCVLSFLFSAVFLVLFAGTASAQSSDVSITLDRDVYAPGQEIIVTTSCPGPTSSAWIGLYEADASSQSYQTYHYISSDPECRLVFDGQDDPGEYEMRFFADSGYEDVLRVPFRVGEQTAETAPAAATTASTETAQASAEAAADGEGFATESGIVFDKESYQTGDTIRVTTDCAAYEPDSWIGIFSPDDAVSDYGTYKADWVYFRDQENCRFEFSGRAFAGEYEVRIVPPHGDFIEVRQVFAVEEGGGEGGITLAKADYSTWEPIEVTTACSPEADMDSDWIALFKAGESSYNYGQPGEDWFYMSEASQADGNCTFTFAARTDTGPYELRQFHGTDYTPYAQLGFEIATTGVQPEPEVAEAEEEGIQMPLSISLAKAEFAVGEPITVAVKCHQKQYPAPDPWIGLRKISEPIHSHPQRAERAGFQEDWFYLKNYTQPGGDCVYEFAGRAEPGRYEVRVFRTLEDCGCTDNLAGRLDFSVAEAAVESAAVSADVLLTEAVSRHVQYDYVEAHSTDCILMDEAEGAFSNTCDFPVSVYVTQKLGYEDTAMQFVEAMATDAVEKLNFDGQGTVSWLACHESQELCVRALDCIDAKANAGETTIGFMTAECSAFEK